jgi:hypothetical protein
VTGSSCRGDDGADFGVDGETELDLDGVLLEAGGWSTVSILSAPTT